MSALRSRRSLAVLMWLLMGLTFYVVSAGPVVFVRCLFGQPEGAPCDHSIRSLYMPAYLALGEPFSDYVDFFDVRGNKFRLDHLNRPPLGMPSSLTPQPPNSTGAKLGSPNPR